MESVNVVKLYDGDGGNAQTEFILDTEVGWEQVVNNPNLHVTEGVSQYEYSKRIAWSGVRFTSSGQCMTSERLRSSSNRHLQCDLICWTRTLCWNHQICRASSIE